MNAVDDIFVNDAGYVHNDDDGDIVAPSPWRTPQEIRRLKVKAKSILMAMIQDKFLPPLFG